MTTTIDTTTSSLAQAIDALPHAMAVIDHRLDVVCSNSAFSELFGTPHLASSLCELAPGWHATRLFLQRGLRASSTTSLSCRLRLGGSEDESAFLQMTPVVVDSGRIAIVSIVPIDRHTMLETSERELVGSMVGPVVHDLNNLLSVILLCSSRVLDSGGSDHSDVQSVIEAASLAQSVVGQLLGPESTDDVVVTDLGETVRGLEHLLSVLLGPAVTLELDLDSRPALLQISRREIERILLNLALNARDAMPDGGRVRVVTEAENSVFLCFYDSGCGMDQETARRMFDPLFTTKDKGHGTGLGLVPLKDLIDRGAVDVEVYSAVGKGTELAVLFRPEVTLAVHGPSSSSSISSMSPREFWESEQTTVRREDPWDEEALTPSDVWVGENSTPTHA